eukprot:6369133-Prorocentrum_lima.AAC.1
MVRPALRSQLLEAAGDEGQRLPGVRCGTLRKQRNLALHSSIPSSTASAGGPLGQQQQAATGKGKKKPKKPAPPL